MHVLFRVDGGPGIGYGHLVRTGALAAALLSRGHDVTYATVSPEYVDEVCPENVSTIELDARTDPGELGEITDIDTDVTVLDSYEADIAYQREIRSETPLVVIVDDTRHAVFADALVNGNLYAEDLEYDVVGADPTWCLGPDYVLLREEITRLAEREPPWREQPERAIVTMGGSDVADATPGAVQAFDGTDLRVDVVVGPGFSNEDEIRDAADEVTADMRVVRNPSNLPELMFEADFAVGACGSTTYELLALGTPLVCSPVVDNQERIATALSERDLATVADEANRRRGFRRGVRRYLEDAELRRRRRAQGRETVDERGTERVCTEVLSIVDENPVS